MYLFSLISPYQTNVTSQRAGMDFLCVYYTAFSITSHWSGFNTANKDNVQETRIFLSSG